MNLQALETYKLYLQRQPISELTRKSYLQRVSKFLQWLDGCPGSESALVDEVERDFHVREFKAHLLIKGVGANTINGMLAAIDSFCLSRGMQPSKVKRLELPRTAPRALDAEEEKRLIKSLARTTLRNRALIMLLWHTGLRISEACGLNFGDLALTARTGAVTVRCGKGMKTRSVPINSELREVLQSYIAKNTARADHEPLFVSQKKSRLSIPSIDRIVRKIGASANIELSAHDLRHSFISSLIRSGADVVIVAELSGHSRLETVRRYSMPTEEQKQIVLERLCRHAV
jgi:site-specific recombinase XerD